MKLGLSVCMVLVGAGCPSEDPPADGESATSSGSTTSPEATSTTGTTSPGTDASSEAGTSVTPPPPGEECVGYEDEATCLAAGCSVFLIASDGEDVALRRVEDDACVTVQTGVCLSISTGPETPLNDYPICYGMPGQEVGFCSLLYDTLPDGWVECRDPSRPAVCEICFGYGIGTSTGGSDTGATDTGGTTTGRTGGG